MKILSETQSRRVEGSQLVQETLLVQECWLREHRERDLAVNPWQYFHQRRYQELVQEK